MSRRRNQQHSAARVNQEPAKGRCEKVSLYDDVTARIVAELEAGRVPWVQPWGGVKTGLGLPKNAATQNPYSGINILILWGACCARDYAQQNWLTYRQAQALGGHVRAGEKGTTVFFAKTYTPKTEVERAAQAGEEPGAVPFLKRFTVFNVAQCDGLPDTATANAAPLPEREAVPVAEDLIKATGAHFDIGGDRAFYAPDLDFVRVPPQPAFFQQIDYYRTCFHELGHWTGHTSRLDRDHTGRFGSHKYAREELVALS